MIHLMSMLLRLQENEGYSSRINRIQENLYTQEPHLAHLLQLHGVGVDMLAREKEKQLRCACVRRERPTSSWFLTAVKFIGRVSCNFAGRQSGMCIIINLVVVIV